MNGKTPGSLVELAFKNQELDKLFLGEDPYKYMTRFYMGPEDSDLSTLIENGIFLYTKEHHEENTMGYLFNTLDRLSMRYDGLMPVVNFIVCSVLYKKNHGELPTTIDINQLAEQINKTINNYQNRLKSDFTGVGFGNNEGKYEYFKNLSSRIRGYGGPNFSSEENNQEDDIKI